MTATKTPAKAAAAKTIRPCICGSVFASYDETDRALEILVGAGTRCTATTANEFAPGHDAKLKSFLITAGVFGLDVSRGDGHWMEATKLAGQFGFKWQVERGIAKSKARAQARTDKFEAKSARKAIKAAAKAEKPAKATKTVEEKPLASNLVTAKVGRWSYRGYVDAAGFHYTNAAGEARVAAVYNIG
jgi:hypothetical protein